MTGRHLYLTILLITAAFVIAFTTAASIFNELSTCADFKNHESAQKAFERGMTKLDGDNDGIACESLL